MDDNNAFLLQQQQAIKRMQEMSNRAQMPNTHKMPPSPPFIKTGQNSAKATPPKPDKQPETKVDPSNLPLDLPFLSSLKSDSDVSLILGLVLILFAENSDRLLLIALVYILL